MTTQDLDGLVSGGGAGRSAFTKNSPIGTQVTGTIINAFGQQRRDYVTGDPKTWGDGSPQMQIAISIQTSERLDADDDGIRGVYVKTWGPQRDALLEAVRNTGRSKLNEVLVPGATFTAEFYGTQPSKQGSDEKLFRFTITPPNGLDQAIAAPATAQAPAAAPAAAAPAPVAATPTAAPQETPAAKAKQLAALGVDHTLIAQQLGVDASVVPLLLAS